MPQPLVLGGCPAGVASQDAHHAFRRRSRRPVPRIERNAIASAKAITAARFAPRGDGSRVVSLDKVIETACETGRDMRVLEC